MIGFRKVFNGALAGCGVGEGVGRPGGGPGGRPGGGRGDRVDTPHQGRTGRPDKVLHTVSSLPIFRLI